MIRTLALALVLTALAACGQSGPGAKKQGPLVAEGKGIAISAEELKARLDEQSPFIRQRFAQLERKKDFLDNLVRFELLANEAVRQGLDKDPEVQLMVKRAMVQKLVQRSFDDKAAADKVPEAELQAYYDAHRDEYQRPAKVRVALLAAADQAAAEKARARAVAQEQKTPGAFATLAREVSTDAATKPMGGDLGFKTKDELASALSPAAAEAAFALAQDAISPVVQTSKGFAVLKRTGSQDEVNRPLEQVRAQIANRLARDQRTKAFDELVKRLRDEAQVKVYDAALEKVEVAPGPAASGAVRGGMGGMMGGPGAHGEAPHDDAPAPSVQPTPAK